MSISLLSLVLYYFDEGTSHIKILCTKKNYTETDILEIMLFYTQRWILKKNAITFK